MKKVSLLVLWNLFLLIPFIFMRFNNSPQCGDESRRHIKTLSDTGAVNINFYPKRADVRELTTLKHDKKITNISPRFGCEYHTYQINCIIQEYYKEENGDYRLILKGVGDSATIIGNIINPDCEDLKNNSHLTEYIKTREEFEKHIISSNKIKSGYYKLIGVCLFSNNSVEIHPILFINKFK